MIVFDSNFYKNFYLELKEQNMTENEIFAHYYNYGQHEGRISSEKDFYNLYPNFDLNFYNMYHDDLRVLQWNSIQLMRHYHCYGKKEGRIITPFTNNFFIIKPRIGLCNQLQTIVKGILLAEKYNRYLYIDLFQKSIDDPNSLCDIREVLDIEKFNKLLKELNLQTKIVSYVNDEIRRNIVQIKNIDYNSIPTMNDFKSIIEQEENMTIQYLDIGNPVMMGITQMFDLLMDDYQNVYYSIIGNIPFHSKFYDKKNEIKKQLNLGKKYTCVHLRIEDDALNHFSKCCGLTKKSYNEKLLKYYTDKINEKTNKNNSRIYVCSGLLYFGENINNKFYRNLMKNNNLCDKQDVYFEPMYLLNRELLAIVDLLISLESTNFIGSGISSFSNLVHCIHKKNKKTSEVFYI